MGNELRLGRDGQRRLQVSGGAQRLHAVREAAGRQEQLVQHRERSIEGRRFLLLFLLGAIIVIRFPSTESERIQPSVGGTGTLSHTLRQTSGILLDPDRPTMKDRRSWGGITQRVWKGEPVVLGLVDLARSRGEQVFRHHDIARTKHVGERLEVGL